MKLSFIRFALVLEGCSFTQSYELTQHGSMRDTLRMGNSQAKNLLCLRKQQATYSKR